MLKAPLFLLLFLFFFCLKQVESLNPSVPPLSLKSISLGFLACRSCPLTHQHQTQPPTNYPWPTYGLPTLSTLPLSFFVVNSSLPLSYTKRFPRGVRGCMKLISKCYWKWKDLWSKTQFFLCCCNVTLWIFMACQVKSFAHALRNKWPSRALNGPTRTHLFARLAAIIAHKEQIICRVLYERALRCNSEI